MTADPDPLTRTPQDLCRAAGLVHVDSDEPGWTRRRQGRGFSYRDERGNAISGPDRERLEAMAIPPAWTDVWICSRTDGHLLAVGRDDAGRRQHLYHPDFRAEAERSKYERLVPFSRHVEPLRRTVVADMGADDLERRMTAGAVRLIDRGLIRVGSDDPEEDDDAVGATTLPTSCVRIDGDVIVIHFTGKGGAERHVTIDDEPILARVVSEGLARGGDAVFSYEAEDESRTVTAQRVNTYLGEVTGQPFTAKDFRTWGGTAIVAGALARSGPPASDDDHDRALLYAVDAAAERLGNTRDVARASYLAPAITDAHRTGALADTWKRTRTGKWATRAERTTRRVLAHRSG